MTLGFYTCLGVPPNAKVQLRANEIEYERSEQPKLARLLQRTLYGTRSNGPPCHRETPAGRRTISQVEIDQTLVG